MSSKQKRPIEDANEVTNPNKRAKRDGEQAATDSSTSSLGASQWKPSPTTPAASAARDIWRLGNSRLAIFAKIRSLEGQGAINAQQNVVRENLARRRVYEDMYAKGCGSSNGAAITVNIEYSVDVRLWTDHVQSHTSEEFPWQQPEMFREDTGYADFVKSIAHAGKWSAIILDNDETIQDQRKKTPTKTEAKLTGEDKDSTNMPTQIDETQIPTEDKDGNRAVGEPQLVVRTKPMAAEPVKEEDGGKVAEAAKGADVVPGLRVQAVGNADDTLWSPEQMTELYEEIFGGDAPRLDGMGGFELPMEASLTTMATMGPVRKAVLLFPWSVEIRPVDLGWGRMKLCLRFTSRVARDKKDFPMHKYYLVWSWCMLVKWKGRLLTQVSGGEETAEPLASMYDGVRWVVDHWTEQAAKKQADLSLVDEAWAKDARADRAGLEDEATKQRLYDAVSKVLASSHGQDDEARACGVVDWAGADPEKFGAGPRTRTYLAIEAMYKYCASQPGEEKLGMIAQHLKSGRHAPPSLLKKRAGQAAKDSKPVPE